MVVVKYLLIVIILISSTAYASEKESNDAPSKLIECAAVFGWVYQSTKNEKSAAKAKEWINIYLGMAWDLTDRNYTFTTFETKRKEFNEKLLSNPNNAKLMLSGEVNRCSKIENLGPEVVKKAKSLMEMNKNEN